MFMIGGNPMHDFVFVTLVVTVLISIGCAGDHSEPSGKPLSNVAPSERLGYYQSLPDMIIDVTKRYVATIKTEKGDIVVELNAERAPFHTNSFVFLSQQGFYDGLTFHRLVPGFILQGGDPSGTGKGGPGYRIPGEFALKHKKGVIAMARQDNNINPDRMSSGSQFYITFEETEYLDAQGYSVFGKVTEGFEVVQKIAIGDRMLRVDVEEIWSGKATS